MPRRSTIVGITRFRPFWFMSAPYALNFCMVPLHHHSAAASSRAPYVQMPIGLS